MAITSNIQVLFEGNSADITATYSQGDTEITVKTSIKINPTAPFSVAQLREAPHRIALKLLGELPITPSETTAQ